MKKRALTVNTFMKWYSADFGDGTTRGTLAFCFSHARGEKRDKLKFLLRVQAAKVGTKPGVRESLTNGLVGVGLLSRASDSPRLSIADKDIDNVRIKYFPYDWGNNAVPGRFVKYDGKSAAAAREDSGSIMVNPKP
mmetsp:Transcript_32542/g.103656  ORF Transcript_32542/g.103656 Transcript_32542/m.103656 type:complete len:136 (+) Transcript_32542:441-848(+)